ncbi:beta-ketoacyl synthase N-terminal-like domain-containing protein [Spirillospora sp. CA-294931]|uniref:beta-ketoacyl synthase N-terminal-like domain-containing protein n=1 Tax=Spirillospora sp. CA-294931 TaxID=3240042 RepID=UPI003D947237
MPEPRQDRYETEADPADIAVVGVGCRFPGEVRDLDGLWRILIEGRDVVEPIPADRWNGSSTKNGDAAHHAGGFLSGIDRFDAGFFGISPREARQMDPQQRLLMEVAWEAMEDSGVPREGWRHSATSLHFGILGSDYMVLHAKTVGPEGVDPYFASGKEFSFAAGRIAYTFDLRGPSMTVNTACSSSLVAVHLACQGLRSGEVDTALAGGVNAMVAPELTLYMDRVQALSRTGRCRPFDARADGVVRGEGCGIVVLKRLEDALRDRDQVYGVIRGSAVNQDGHSAGLTAPSAPAQRELLVAALRAARLGAREPCFVEAHGTGTPLGDPLEISALAEVLGAGRADGSPLLVGSHKANFGHMDSAAGIAGLLKTLLVLRHRTVPPQVHYATPSPLIDWAGSGVAVPTAATPLPAEGPLVAGVSAFGLSGTNAHVLLSTPPEPAPVGREEGAAPPHTVTLSSSTPKGLRALAGDYARALREEDAPVAGIAVASTVRRTHLAHRLAVVGDSGDELAAGLEAFERGEAHPSVADDLTEEQPPPVAFVFSGQGSQWPGMGLDLYGRETAVTETLDECDAVIAAHGGWSLLDALRDEEPARLRATEVAQPALFALQVALARLWRSWGVAPDVVIGHSMGEIAAACVAGALALPDAARLIVDRGRLMQRATGSGRMVAVELSAEDARRRLAGGHPEVCVATENGPRSVVLAGPAGPVEKAARELERDGVTTVPLGVDYAFHSPAMRPHADELEGLLKDLPVTEPEIPLLSTVDPALRSPLMDAAYWGRSLRDPVLLWPAADALLAEGDAAFVEIGAHPVLTRPLRAALAEHDRVGPVVGSLARGQSGPATLARARARLHTAGIGVDWAAVAGGPVRAVHLPPPRWADERHWLPGVTRGQQEGAASPAAVRAEVRLYDAAGELIAELSGAPGEVRPVEEPAPNAPTPVPAPVPDRERAAAVVHRVLLDVLGHPPGHRLPRTRGLFDLGLDSVSTVRFARDLEEALGCEVTGADVLAHATIDALADHVLSLGPTTRETSAEPGPAPEPERAAVRPGGAEPIAIVGIGCRLPGGVHGPAGFWRLLSERTDTTGEVPADRWNAAALLADGQVSPGTTVTGRGAFLDAIDGFDNAFFRVSPHEARSMDPQQRLFLEVAWEALEDAGLPAERLRGGRTGVFVGLNTTDYQQLVTAQATDIDLYYGTGNSFSGAAGRLSYFLGVRGPSIAVDTACSSSLTAVHLACQSLRTGESEVALAGGANAMCTPTVFLSMSSAGALAPDGRCKTFDDSADGYGRGEGSGAVVLKTLSRALKDGDRVYAVIRGSAVNQDGASGGLTVPSGEAQQEVVRAALEQAGARPAQIGYVEAHGTGTRLGDAIELRALSAELGAGRDARDPLLVGSVKTNMGHLEAASGIAGLIKTVLALHHEEIPAHLHVSTPTRQVDWERLAVRVATDPVSWPRGSRPRLAGVSAFGFTGTNAHVVVQEAPVQAPPAGREAAPGRPLALAVSGATRAALDAAADRLRAALRDVPDADLPHLCWTSGARRTHHEHRAVVVGAGRRDLVAGLDAVRDGTERPGVRAGVARPGEHKRLAFYFGPEAPAPVDGVPDDPPWAADLGEAFALWRAGTVPEAGSPERDLVTLAGHLAMTAVWESYGLVPDTAVGTGAGAYAAACATRELSVADAAGMLTGEHRSGGDPPGVPARYRVRGEWADIAERVTGDGAEAVLGVDGPSGDGPLAVSAPPGAGPGDLLDVVAALHAHGCRVDWDRVVPAGGRLVALPRYPWQHRSHWIAAAPAEKAPAAPEQPEETGRLAAEVAALPPDARRDHVIEAVIELACAVLGGVDDIAPDQGFFDLGMDSVLSARLKAAAERDLGCELPGTVMFECPNAASFADFILAEVLDLGTATGEGPGGDGPDGLDDLDEQALADRLLTAIATAESMLNEGDRT